MENHYMYELSYNTKKNCLNWHLHKLLQLFYFHPIRISLKIPLKKNMFIQMLLIQINRNNLRMSKKWTAFIEHF